MEYIELHPTWPTSFNPAVNAASGIVGFVSLLFFYEALVAKKIVSSSHETIS
jgi:hypothetical protein